MEPINATPLYSLNKDERVRLCGRAFDLPKARFASEPYVYKGGEPPVPHGTKISIWHFPTKARSPWDGWWVGLSSNAETWLKPRVFRLRNIKGPEIPKDNGTHGTLERIADALERIAQAIEAGTVETERLDAQHESAVRKDAPNT